VTAGGAIVVVGDAALDVLARHAGAVVPGGDQPADVRTALGGAGANTAAWLAWLGERPVLVGRVGDDPAGRQMVADLTAAGVDCSLAVDAAAPTCCVVVLVDGWGERTMLSDRGAGALLRSTDLPPEVLAGGRHLHLSGYVLLDATSREAGLAMLAAARAAGLSTSVDPQVAAPLPGFLEWVGGVDLLLPNSAELAVLTGSAEPESAVALLGDVGAVAVTRGAAGAAWVDADGLVSVAAAPVECVDSTGAGDAFNAATLVAWLSGAPPLDTIRAGVRAGTAAVGQVGAQPVRTR
jgi:sugar/nucleoside kinase (ribokinase family)